MVLFRIAGLLDLQPSLAASLFAFDAVKQTSPSAPKETQILYAAHSEIVAEPKLNQARWGLQTSPGSEQLQPVENRRMDTPSVRFELDGASKLRFLHQTDTNKLIPPAAADLANAQGFLSDEHNEIDRFFAPHRLVAVADDSHDCLRTERSRRRDGSEGCGRGAQ